MLRTGALLLPTASGAAAEGRRRCYRWRAALLRTAGGDATEAWRACYTGTAALLQLATCPATDPSLLQIRPCYRCAAALLQLAAGPATEAWRLCYKRWPVLLPLQRRLLRRRPAIRRRRLLRLQRICYKRLEALLPAAEGSATSGGRCCYRCSDGSSGDGRLSGDNAFATSGGRLCYKWWPVLLLQRWLLWRWPALRRRSGPRRSGWRETGDGRDHDEAGDGTVSGSMRFRLGEGEVHAGESVVDHVRDTCRFLDQDDGSNPSSGGRLARSLEQLDLSNCSDMIFLKIPHLLMQLNLLRVQHCHKLQITEANAPKLRDFTYTGMPIHISLGDSSQVRVIEMHCEHESNMIYYARTKLPSIAQNLQILHLSSCNEMINIPMITEKFNFLKYLELAIMLELSSLSPDFDFHSLVSFLDASHALETFILRVEAPALRHDVVLECSDGESSRPGCLSGYRHEKLRNMMVTGFCSAKSMIELTNHILEKTVTGVPYIGHNPWSRQEVGHD